MWKKEKKSIRISLKTDIFSTFYSKSDKNDGEILQSEIILLMR